MDAGLKHDRTQPIGGVARAWPRSTCLALAAGWAALATAAPAQAPGGAAKLESRIARLEAQLREMQRDIAKLKGGAAPAAATPDAAPASATPPSSGDPAEDAYMAGYRLWTQKKYAEAETALRDGVAKYPQHRRASYAQNLLGRAYLDEGKPALAAKAFYENYKNRPRGERAPDSLYFLGQALSKLGRPVEACRAYAELSRVYGTSLAEPLAGRAKQARTDAKCSS